EDGIRDFHVTGVQTCALPISRAYAVKRGLLASICGTPGRNMLGDEIAGGLPLACRLVPAAAAIHGVLGWPVAISCRATGCARSRSEERRVGKAWGVREAEEDA